MSNKKQTADQMVNEYRMILMNEDTDCGNEILCTMIAIKCALVAVNGIIKANPHLWIQRTVNYVGVSRTYDEEVLNKEYWREVKKEIETYEQ